MTVAEIQEYIDNAIETAFAQNIEMFCIADIAENLRKALINTKSMLDELEDRPKAKWEESNSTTEYFGKLSRCSKCGYETFPQDDTNYCGGCGARMNDELKENE